MTNSLKIGLSLFCFLALNFSVIANNKLITLAKENYTNKNYEQSIENYTKLLSLDSLNPEIHYNLGNSYFKVANYTMAILHYEKTIKFDPDNEDALHNLKLAQKNTIDKIDGEKKSSISLFIDKITLGKKTTVIANLAIILLSCWLILFSVFILARNQKIKKYTFYSGLVALLFSIFFNYNAYNKLNTIQSSKFAIIYEPTVNVMNEPTVNGKKIFSLHEGTKVKIIDTQEEYIKIILINKNQGWIKNNSIKRI